MTVTNFTTPSSYNTDRELPLLEVQGLRVHIPGPRGLVEAVDGVSFTVSKGELVGIVGESGCGKSMLALSIMRLVPEPGRVVDGRITLGGRDLLGLAERDMRSVRGGEIGMIFQDPSASLNPVMRVGRQVRETLEAHHAASGAKARQLAVDMLRAVRIPDPETRSRDYPHQYSGGMRQRVVIAIGTANRPQLLIADEPTTALDVTVQAQIIELLRSMNEVTGTAIILITHNIALVSRFCTRVLVMYAGRIVESGPTLKVFEFRAILTRRPCSKRFLASKRGWPRGFQRSRAGRPILRASRRAARSIRAAHSAATSALGSSRPSLSAQAAWRAARLLDEGQRKRRTGARDHDQRTNGCHPPRRSGTAASTARPAAAST